MGGFALSLPVYGTKFTFFCYFFKKGQGKMSTDITWAITRNNSAFLLKKRGCPKPFSTDPMNLTNKHSMRHTGTVNKKALAIAPAADNKGFTVTMKAGPRRSLHKVKALVVKQRYRKDLSKAAL